MIVGAYGNDGAGGTAGHARIYEWNGTNWNQLIPLQFFLVGFW